MHLLDGKIAACEDRAGAFLAELSGVRHERGDTGSAARRFRMNIRSISIPLRVSPYPATRLSWCEELTRESADGAVALDTPKERI